MVEIVDIYCDIGVLLALTDHLVSDRLAAYCGKSLFKRFHLSQQTAQSTMCIPDAFRLLFYLFHFTRQDRVTRRYCYVAEFQQII